MKKYSRLDLLNSAVLDNAGGIVSKFFEAKTVRLNIQIGVYDLKRAQVFVGTVNEIVEDHTDKIFTVEGLIDLILKCDDS